MDHNYALDLAFIFLFCVVGGCVIKADRRHRDNKNMEALATLGIAFIFAGTVEQLMLYTGVGGNLTNVAYWVFMIPFVVGAVLTLPLAGWTAIKKFNSWYVENKDK